MRVGVLTPGPSPYAAGGAERVARGLTEWIAANTEHDAELVTPPSPEQDLPEVVASYEMWAGLDVDRFDLVISTKYPSWMIDHPCHAVLLFHPLRGLYDTYPAGLPSIVDASRAADPDVAELLALTRRPPERAPLGELFARLHSLLDARGPDDPLFAFPGPFARQLVQFLDRVGLDARRVRRHYGISATVAVKRNYFPAGVDAGVLMTPSNLRGLRCGRFDHFFTASRLEGPKRIDLLVRAMRHVPGRTALKIAGTGPDDARLRELARDDDRIEFLGPVSDEQLAELYADALAVPFVPFDEDLGLITLEAMTSGKPVVTCTDSGGPTELVTDGVDGLVTAPDPRALGRALTRLAVAPAIARRMGAEGRRRAERVTWARVATALLEARDHPTAPARRPERPKLVVTSTFPVHPPMGGGQLRCHHLYGALTAALDVEIVSLAPTDRPAARVVYGPGFVETVIPKSPEHEAAEKIVERLVDMPVTDIVAPALVPHTPGYVEALREALVDARAVIFAHPYLGPIVRDLRPDLPVVYDAHNAEFALKDTVLPHNRAGDGLRELVRRIEGTAVRDARLVSGCSHEDHELLEAEYGAHPFVHVANGVDTDAIGFVDPRRRARAGEVWRLAFERLNHHLGTVAHLALFVGSWHPPNLDAVEHIFMLAEEMRSVGFLVAGSVCNEFWSRPRPSNVLLLGIVSDSEKRALLEAADVAVTPMLRGSGTNLKMVEYLAAGIPTVSTEIAARGLEVEDGRDVLIRDLDDFPRAIRGLLGNPAEREKLVEHGRAVVAARYDWRVLGAELLAALASAVTELGLESSGSNA